MNATFLAFSFFALFFNALHSNNLQPQGTAITQEEACSYFSKKLIKKPRLENNLVLANWINENLETNADEVEKLGDFSSVTVRFIVNENGDLENPSIAFGIGNGFDEKAYEIIKSCRLKWIPGETKSNRVATEIYYKIDFKTKKHSIVTADNQPGDFSVKF